LDYRKLLGTIRIFTQSNKDNADTRQNPTDFVHPFSSAFYITSPMMNICIGIGTAVLSPDLIAVTRFT